MLVKMGTKAMMKLRIQMPTINEITTFRLKIERFSGNQSQCGTAQTMELNAENNYFCKEETNKWVLPQIEKIGWIQGKRSVEER